MRALLACTFALALAGCGPNGTFVLLEISGAGLPAVARVSVSATFAGSTRTTDLTDPSGTVALPTSAAIAIERGDGELRATAEAFDQSGASLAKVTNSVTVERDKVVRLALALGGSGSSDLAVPPGPPAVPLAVGACGANNQVRVSYAVPAGATGINIYYQGKPGVTKANGTKVVANTSPPFVVTGLTNLVNYSFVVTAVNEKGESAESQEVTARPDPVVHDALFSTSANNGVEIWDCVHQLPASSPPTRTLRNPAITGALLGSVAVDPGRAILYVSTTDHVLVFDNATAVNATAGASRTIDGAFGGHAITVDGMRRRLYVDTVAMAVNVYAASDTVSGSAATAAQLTGLRGLDALSMDVANDRLYVGAGDDLFVINAVSARNGSVAVAGAGVHWTISGATMPVFSGVGLDGTTLYVADRNSSTVYQLRNINTANAGALTDSGQLILPAGAGAPLSVAANTLFIAPFGDPMSRILVYQNVGALVGQAAPSQQLVSGLGKPNHALYIP
jgi:hypothetical protein